MAGGEGAGTGGEGYRRGRALAESREDGGKRREAGKAARGSLPGVQGIQELCVGLEVEP